MASIKHFPDFDDLLRFSYDELLHISDFFEYTVLEFLKSAQNETFSVIFKHYELSVPIIFALLCTMSL